MSVLFSLLLVPISVQSPTPFAGTLSKVRFFRAIVMNYHYKTYGFLFRQMRRRVRHSRYDCNFGRFLVLVCPVTGQKYTFLRFCFTVLVSIQTDLR